MTGMISKELLDYAKENGLKFDIHHRKDNGYKEDFDGFSYTDRGFGYVISADMMQQLYQDRQRYGGEVLNDLHASIVERHELELGSETDQAFNYARIHRWIDEQRKLNNDMKGKL